MVQEQFGFGVNEVALEGSGKLFEVLARNKGQQAAVAGRDAGTAMQQYSQGMSDFNRYFQASQNTEQAANATASRANQAINQGNAGLNRAGQRVLQDNIRKAGDVVTAVNSLMKSGQAFASTLERSRLQEGMVDGMRTAGEISLIQDPAEKKQTIEGFLTQYQENPSSPYNQGMSRSIFPLYAGAVKEVDIKRREIGIRSMLSMADNSYVNSGDKLLYNMPELQKFAKAQNLSMGEFRDALYSTTGGTVAEGISKASDFNMLGEAIDKWSTIKENNFNNDFFLKTKNRQTQELIGKTDRTIALAVTQAKSKIKTQAQTDWTKITDNPKAASTDQVEYTLNNMQLSPIEKQNKAQAYSKKYAEQAIDEQFRTEFSEISPSPYWDDIPSETKKAAENKIGTAGAKAFLFKQPERLQEILQAHPGHVKEIGVQIGKIFDNGTGQEKGIIYDNLMLVRETSSASQALSQTMSDGQLTNILTIGSLAKSMGGSTVQQVEDNWDKATQMLANQQGMAGMKLSPGSDKDLYEDVTKAALKMGENGGRFLQTMQTLFKKNPDIANEQFDTLADYYDNLSDTNSYSGQANDFELTENFAHGADPFVNTKTGLPEDVAEEAKGKFLEHAYVNFVKKNGYEPDFTSITYLGGDIISIKDGWTNEVMSVPVRKFIDAEREAHFDKQKVKAIRAKSTREKLNDMTILEALDNVVEDAASFMEWLSNAEVTRSE